MVALEPGEVSVLTLPGPRGPITLNVIVLDANHCLVRSQRACMPILTAPWPAQCNAF